MAGSSVDTGLPGDWSLKDSGSGGGSQGNFGDWLQSFTTPGATWGSGQSVVDINNATSASQNAAVNAENAQTNVAQNQIDVANQLRAFFQQMQQPLDANNPMYKAILDQAGAQSLNTSNDAGVQGPVAVNQSLLARGLAQSGLQQQRQQMGLQALTGASNALGGATSANASAGNIGGSLYGMGLSNSQTGLANIGTLLMPLGQFGGQAAGKGLFGGSSSGGAAATDAGAVAAA